MYVRLHNATVLDCRWKRNSICPGAGGCEFLSYFVSFVFFLRSLLLVLCCSKSPARETIAFEIESIKQIFG